MYLITLPWQHEARAVAEAVAEEPPSLQSRTLKVSASLLSLWLPPSLSFVALLEFNYGTQVEETKISQPKGNPPTLIGNAFMCPTSFQEVATPFPLHSSVFQQSFVALSVLVLM